MTLRARVTSTALALTVLAAVTATPVAAATDVVRTRPGVAWVFNHANQPLPVSDYRGTVRIDRQIAVYESATGVGAYKVPIGYCGASTFVDKDGVLFPQTAFVTGPAWVATPRSGATGAYDVRLDSVASGLCP